MMRHIAQDVVSRLGAAALGGTCAPADVGTAAGGRGVRYRARRDRPRLAGVSGPLAGRTTLVRATERPTLAPDLADAVAQAGVDPTLEGRALQDALLGAIATRRGHSSRTVHHAGWVVSLHLPEKQDFSGKTLEGALAWCLVRLMAPELGIGPFLV
jgi:hypothetical protein